MAPQPIMATFDIPGFPSWVCQVRPPPRRANWGGDGGTAEGERDAPGPAVWLVGGATGVTVLWRASGGPAVLVVVAVDEPAQHPAGTGVWTRIGSWGQAG